MKKLCCALLACLPLSVMAYPIEVEKQLNGAEVAATTQEIDHNMGGLQLYNYGRAAAQCTALFRNGPEAPRTRKVRLSAGESSSLAVKFSRSIIKLRVKLTCEVS
ncbi:3-phosphoglycerate kinase [Pseudomonas sp. HMWF032]|uniref:3-phosphoglycerate kinase n=1 Tax=Pseudomonas sp. HMWF032 TaxID=2056866 RepID=UPI000D37EBE0|nr:MULTISPECIES: 3-phosphoglycerate kinase [unclassified Pseudomonas]PTS83785.1 3-phosphoglycerate kinase [Pseudomonas sp. HMWF032]PTT80420.1 3-phosphoglycerate kinase [Pseudomonas sp. HMWF010]WAC45030.1 3-phosphoglycerate kinase [Pseudomonas sp. SL4(2022)]